jgi:hypothetical protein
MKRQARSSKDSSCVPAEAAVARAPRPAYDHSRSDDYQHRPPQSYSYSRSQMAVPDRFDYVEDDEVTPALQRLPSQERVPQSHFPASADAALDDPLQRWKMIEEGRDCAPGDGRNYRRHHANRYDTRATAVGASGVPRHSPLTYQPEEYGISSSFASSHPRYGQGVAIVSPVFDDYGEQSLSSRISSQRSTNEWDELKPPPFSANDHLYHHNHYQRGDEESYHQHSYADHSYGSRHYHARPPLPPKPTAKMMEISPGSFVRLRGADETYQAVANDFYTPCQCMICSSSSSPSQYHRPSDEEPLFCIQDADFFLCPNCKSICPLEDDVSNQRSGGAGGVGLGFTLEMLIQIQEEIVSHRAQAAH